MKPIRIVIEGINSFTDPQTLDFEAVGRTNLFCISGKTGAGKTTVFDSIMFALYGGIGRGKLVDIVNLSRTRARVVLDFIENGDMYTVDRSIVCKQGRKTANTECTLYKNGEIAANAVGEINTVIRDIVGLDESEFKNVYLLEQGEYADFLKKTPSEQMIAVGKIFSLMRFDEVSKRAKDRRNAEESAADAQSKLVEAFGDVNADTVQAEKTALASLKAKTTSLKKSEEAGRAEFAALTALRDKYNEARTKQENVKNLKLQEDAKRKESDDAKAVLEEFEKNQDRELLGRIEKMRVRSEELVALNARDKECFAAENDAAVKRAAADKQKADERAAKTRARELAELLEAAEREFEKCTDAFRGIARRADKRSALLEAAVSKVNATADDVTLASVERDIAGEADRYGELRGRADAKAKDAELAAEDCNKKLRTIELYAAELGKCESAVASAEKKRDGAAQALEAAQLNSHAQAVRAELRDGDTCPVCGGRYSHGGDGCGDTDVAGRKAECDAAIAVYENAVVKKTECERTLDRAKTEYAHAEEKKKAAETERDGLYASAAAMNVDPALYAELKTALQAAMTGRKNLAAAKDRADKHAAECALAGERLAAAETAAAETAKRAADLIAELGDVRGKTDGLLAEHKKALSELERKAERVEARRKNLTAGVDRATAALEALSQSLLRAQADCPIDLPEFDEEKYNEKTAQNEQLVATVAANEAEIARREAEVKAHEQSLEKMSRASAERDAHVKKAKIYAELFEITKSKAMLNFVAAEYIDDFTAVASDILSELSSGKYTMGYDKENGFYVSDFLNNGKQRKTETLSGGELFLASLSVAIAIARTQAGGNNAFFFLDEGFGTLDDELIDTVYAALESLSRDCLVGVISHSGALIEKMPSCVEVVEANDTTGSIIRY